MICLLEPNYEPVIASCFAEDPELLQTYHVSAPADLDTCVQRTIKDLTNADESFKFFTVFYGGDLVGFFGEEDVAEFPAKNLTSFFIRPAYRNRQSIKEFWSLVVNHFESQPFITGVYQKNTRASNFLKKNNCLLVSELTVGNEPASVFVYNGETSCP